MKLRCTTNSIRIRIRRSELDAFAREGIISDTVAFPGGARLQFSLQRSTDQLLTAQFIGGHLRVLIPEASAKKWIATEMVGLEADVALPGEEKTLHILIEKDFPCLHRTHEDKTDTFTELAPDQP